jgi:hypothetical protein
VVQRRCGCVYVVCVCVWGGGGGGNTAWTLSLSMLDRERQAPMTPRLPRGDYGEIGKLSGNLGSLDLNSSPRVKNSYFIYDYFVCLFKVVHYYCMHNHRVAITHYFMWHLVIVEVMLGFPVVRRFNRFDVLFLVDYITLKF